MKKNIIIMLVIVAGVSLILVQSILAQGFHTFGPGTISSVRRDSMEGRFVITSGETVYLVNADDCQIVEEYQLPFWALTVEPGNPADDMYYGIGEIGVDYPTANVFSIDLSTGQITSTNIGIGFHARVILQDETRIFVVSSNSAPAIPGEDRGRVFVFSKTDLTPLEDWQCKDRPRVGIINNADGKIYVPSIESQYGTVMDEGMTYPSNEFWYYLGCYDSNRGGELIYEDYKIPGLVTGMAVMNDGAVVAGMSGAIDWQKPNLAIINDPIEEIYIPGIDLSPLDCDIETNRIFAAVRDYNTGKRYSNGLILNWDYDTGEYEIIDSGIQGLREVTYCDGKLYGITTKDNKLYVIDID